ncbi:MAG: NAD-reducing hydrogenase HoxS beta subunit [Nitrospirae bacterium]|nr:MAG: NAD-reducing hydrogenase HoxS beta subunit [Nitrospirota bacterium]
MSKKITIEPLTKLEGHGKVTINLNDKGEVSDAHFHVTEFRGFEKFCEGRMLWDMPVITTRVCGICPVSHHLASAKACDNLLGITIPETAKKLRELMHMGQFIHSHALHFFFLAAPDMVVGPGSAPKDRSVIGILERSPETAQKAIKLRKIGQEIIDRVGARAIHPVTAIPGGMSKTLSHEDRFFLSKEINDAIPLSEMAVELALELIEKYPDMIEGLGKPDGSFMGLTNKNELELYDGTIRLRGKSGDIEFDPLKYLDYIGEHVEDSSWLKFPFYKKDGWPDGSYRVGPLARLNVSEAINTPMAEKRFKEFKAKSNGKPLGNNIYYHWARTIELLHAAEKAKELLKDDAIVGDEFRVRVERKAGEGIGVIEAPRGTLIHHYTADDNGRIKKANLIVATAHNNRAIDVSVAQAAKYFIKDGKMSEGILNRIEMAVRCYDPCLSCATHAIGKMPLEVTLLSGNGVQIDAIRRD